MDCWENSVALVTGASSGIGAAVAKGLVKQGLKVVGVARRVHIVEEFASELIGSKGQLFPYKADISKEEDVLSLYTWIKENLGGADVLVNNAAIEEMCSLTETMDTGKFRATFEVNIIGSNICTREAIKSMKERGVDDGHVININSTAGHYVINFPGLLVHCAAKHALTVLTEGLRRELVQNKSKIRVTSVSPGAVCTENVQKEIELGTLPSDMPMLNPEDVVSAIIFALGAPPHVQVHEITVRPVGEEF